MLEEGAYFDDRHLQSWEDMQMVGYTGLRENSKQTLES